MVCLEFFSPPLEFFTPPPPNDLSFSEFYQILGGTAPLVLPPWERPCYQYNHTELCKFMVHMLTIKNRIRPRDLCMIPALEALKENDFLMIQKRDSAFFVELL